MQWSYDSDSGFRTACSRSAKGVAMDGLYRVWVQGRPLHGGTEWGASFAVREWHSRTVLSESLSREQAFALEAGIKHSQIANGAIWLTTASGTCREAKEICEQHARAVLGKQPCRICGAVRPPNTVRGCSSCWEITRKGLPAGEAHAVAPVQAERTRLAAVAKAAPQRASTPVNVEVSAISAGEPDGQVVVRVALDYRVIPELQRTMSLEDAEAFFESLKAWLTTATTGP